MEILLDCFCPSASELQYFTVIGFNIFGTWLKHFGYVLAGK